MNQDNTISVCQCTSSGDADRRIPPERTRCAGVDRKLSGESKGKSRADPMGPWHKREASGAQKRELQLEIASAYWKIGEIQSDNAECSLGDTAGAVDSVVE